MTVEGSTCAGGCCCAQRYYDVHRSLSGSSDALRRTGACRCCAHSAAFGGFACGAASLRRMRRRLLAAPAAAAPGALRSVCSPLRLRCLRRRCSRCPRTRLYAAQVRRCARAGRAGGAAAAAPDARAGGAAVAAAAAAAAARCSRRSARRRRGWTCGSAACVVSHQRRRWCVGALASTPRVTATGAMCTLLRCVRTCGPLPRAREEARVILIRLARTVQVCTKRTHSASLRVCCFVAHATAAAAHATRKPALHRRAGSGRVQLDSASRSVRVLRQSIECPRVLGVGHRAFTRQSSGGGRARAPVVLISGGGRASTGRGFLYGWRAASAPCTRGSGNAARRGAATSCGRASAAPAGRGGSHRKPAR
jgi:hypothetical protein